MTTTGETHGRPLLWYAMSSPYGRERMAEEALRQRNVECFVPKKRVETIDAKSNRVVRYVPVIRNLIFVRSTEDGMRLLKPQMNQLIQFLMCPSPAGNKVPVIVPDKQMADFIRLYMSMPDDLVYLSPDEIHGLKENARVVIGDGVFQGLEGYYQRIEGKRQKRFIVKIEDFIACAALIVDCNFIKLPKGK